MNSTDYANDPRAVLIHFNPNHDKLGRFSKSRNATGRRVSDNTEHVSEESKVSKAVKKLKDAISNGHVYIDDTMDNLRNMQFMQMINDQQIMNQKIQNQLLIQQSIQEANRCASLSMTMGMNPFMFG